MMILLKPDVDIDALSPNLAALTAISQQIGCNGFFPFQIRPGKTKPMGECFPGDRDCGRSGNGKRQWPDGAWLVHHGLMAHDGKTLQIQGHQGRALGKEGTVDVTVTIRDNQPENVTISGRRSFCFMPNGPLLFNLCQARKSSRQKLFSRLRMGIKCSHYRGQLRLGKTVLYIIYAETKLLLK